jgi:hypothetical protein
MKGYRRGILSLSSVRNVLFSGGKGVIERWKWYGGVVEMGSVSGGNGVRKWWKWCGGAVEK